MEGPIQAAAYRQTFARIRQYDQDFEDPIASPGEVRYTRTDVARLEDVLRGKIMEGCRAPNTGTRRPQSPGDRQFPTQGDALAEALKRHGVDPSTVEVTPMYGKNPNLVGPKGEPWEIVSGLDSEGELIRFQNHSNGHSFSDTGEFELPHYRGPNGEHLSY